MDNYTLDNLQAPIGVLPHCPTCPFDWKATNQIEDPEGNNVVVLIMLIKIMSFHSFIFCICFETFRKYFQCLYLVWRKPLVHDCQQTNFTNFKNKIKSVILTNISNLLEKFAKFST